MKSVLKIVFYTFIVALVIRVFILDTFVVRGSSMTPTINDGDLVFVSRLSYLGKNPKRGDIIVAEPRNSFKKVVKRIIALPGERTVLRSDGSIVITKTKEKQDFLLNEHYVVNQRTGSSTEMLYETLDPEEYLIFGDNRQNSIDSKEFGPVDLWDIKGKVILSI